MKNLTFFFIAAIFLILFSCDNDNNKNPAAKGFNMESSDSMAVAVADHVMNAMGGRKNWDQTQIFSWSFGSRKLIWNKESGDVRIEIPEENIVLLYNHFSDAGRAFVTREEVVDTDSLLNMMEKAKRIWINDSYWLVMPFKLKDSGVTLKYLGMGETKKGVESHILELTFNNVGVTPENKYEVYVDSKSYLVNQWAWYRDYKQDSATAVWPFDNYQKMEGILLSTDRSDGRGPKNVAVLKDIDPSLFTDL